MKICISPYRRKLGGFWCIHTTPIYIIFMLLNSTVLSSIFCHVSTCSKQFSLAAEIGSSFRMFSKDVIIDELPATVSKFHAQHKMTAMAKRQVAPLCVVPAHFSDPIHPP